VPNAVLEGDKRPVQQGVGPMSYQEQPKAPMSRRSMIVKGAGLAAAGVVATSVPFVATKVNGAPATAGHALAEPAVPVMVHWRSTSGAFDIFVGEELFEISDPAFAAKLVEMTNG
jgi:hypothetical protein